ncbi:MAG: diaminopimelate decarboxylase family protein [Intestinimonas sp.]
MMETKNGRLFFDGCDVTELAKKYGTPLYVYSQTAIERRFDELRRDFLDRWPGSRVAYAAKAFCTTGMCRLVERAGMCVDVVSGGELYTALAAGFPPERIEFNGNNKLPGELELAVDRGVGGSSWTGPTSWRPLKPSAPPEESG